jgi:glucose-6-phosphate isomerase
MIRLDPDHVSSFLGEDELEQQIGEARRAHRTLVERDGPGSGATGWRDILANPDDGLLETLSETAHEIRDRADVFICVGIGGSYLGAKAVIKALSPYLGRAGGTGGSPEILFAGHHLSGAYLRELLDYVGDRSVYLNVISKSGTTLEPALAFRLLRKHLEETFEDASRRIILTTDPSSGALNTLHEERGYRKFVIPRSIGGRFSVLTPVGLLPIAAAGIDIGALFLGAASARDTLQGPDDNPALAYAAIRSGLLQRGLTVDLLATFEPRLHGIGLWWQQLFGESEGKQGTGLFPVVAQYSTDLHSIGQYVQDGQRTMMETFLMLKDDAGSVEVPHSKADLDGLNYLSGRTMGAITRAAHEGTSKAHADGGVPNLTLWMERLAPRELGEAIYFFEHAVAVSGYMLGVNPFDQPGVEAYKNEMFSRLGRP